MVLLLILAGLRIALLSTKQDVPNEPIVIDLPVETSSPIVDLKEKQEIVVVPITVEIPVTAEIKDVVVEIPKEITIQEIKETPVTVTEVAITEEAEDPIAEEPVGDASIEEPKIIVTYEDKAPVSTMSCPDEPTMEVVAGFIYVVGAFNDIQDGGTILYSVPALKMDLTKIDGLGFGATAYLSIGLEGTDSLLASTIIGASYTKNFSKTSLSLIGGVYGSHMQYRRDEVFNELNSLGLGLDIKFMLPETKNGHRWGVTSNIASGFLGDPNGSVTLGFVLK